MSFTVAILAQSSIRHSAFPHFASTLLSFFARMTTYMLSSSATVGTKGDRVITLVRWCPSCFMFAVPCEPGALSQVEVPKKVGTLKQICRGLHSATCHIVDGQNQSGEWKVGIVQRNHRMITWELTVFQGHRFGKELL